MSVQTTNQANAMTGQSVLKRGDQGSEVQRMCRLLAYSRRGFYFDKLARSDYFDYQIEGTVKQFQEQVFLLVDGVVGPQTWTALYANGPVDMEMLRRGDRGNTVRQAQARLQLSSYYTGAIDGDFGPKTYQAVVDFQASRRLNADGIIGPNTWDALSWVIR